MYSQTKVISDAVVLSFAPIHYTNSQVSSTNTPLLDAYHSIITPASSGQLLSLLRLPHVTLSTHPTTLILSSRTTCSRLCFTRRRREKSQ
jgi:hypothetical protein